jgi:hypothetical protein
MKLEFIKDSPELIEFEKTLKWKDNIDPKYSDVDDDRIFYAIYFQESSNKYYKVEMIDNGGIYSKPKHAFYRRNFKKSEPWVVTFYEVKSAEVTIVEWVDIED